MCWIHTTEEVSELDEYRGEAEICFSMTSISNALSCKEYSPKTPNDMIKHVHFRLSSDDPVITKRPLLFLDFVCHSTYILGTDPSDAMLSIIVVSI